MKKNQKIKMSKRSGDYVTLRDVIDEVGADVLRFMMISRNCDKKIDFDFDGGSVIRENQTLLLPFFTKMLIP